MRNIVLIDLHCSRSENNSNRCLSKQSYVKVTCEKGYIFINRQQSFNSLCLQSGLWEQIPRCIKLTVPTTPRPLTFTLSISQLTTKHRVISTTSPKTSSTTKQNSFTPLTRSYVRNCDLRKIPNQISLMKSKLLLLDLHCTRAPSNSFDCETKESFITYSCQKGYIFENFKGLFKNILISEFYFYS